MKKNRDFKGNFAKNIKNFIEYKRALGFVYEEGEYILARFDDFCCKYFPDAIELNKDIGLKWAETLDGEGGAAQSNRICVIREFGKYLNSIGIAAYIIPPNIHSKRQRPQAYIYSDEELSAIFKAADNFEPDWRSPLLHLVVPVAYRLMYCCGLRPVEIRRLHCADINFETGEIKILESKGHKDRLVVMADDMLALAKTYHQKIDSQLPNRTYFFHNDFFRNNLKKGMYSQVWMTKTFRKLLDTAGISKIDTQRPRAYDLRHTFATHRLSGWLKEGEDVGACISYLSEYMGHERLSDTAYYIHLVPEFYSQEVNQRFQVKADVLPEVPA